MYGNIEISGLIIANVKKFRVVLVEISIKHIFLLLFYFKKNFIKEIKFVY